MKQTKLLYDFSADKNQKLIKERNVSFEDVIEALNNGKLLDTINHHNGERYPHQRIYVVDLHGYAYAVPFVMNVESHKIFLKTIIPNRDLTKKYLG